MEIPHLSENHEFSLREPPFKRKSLVFFSENPHLIEYQLFYLRESNI
ncbi:hypothetical protein CP10743SC13_1771 [Chlamydia psittaci 10_743_SC13]|nr:hypothetical protein CP10743SC13_1771 [Chlamydia psittaci 10_743_SC13]